VNSRSSKTSSRGILLSMDYVQKIADWFVNKKLLVLGVLVMVVIVGFATSYRSFVQKQSSSMAPQSGKVSFEKAQSADGSIIISFLARYYGFTINGGFPSLTCYEKNPRDASSGKIGYVLCDENTFGGGYFSVMWRDTTKDISMLQSAVLRDILQSKSSGVTLVSPSLYTETMFVCKKDETFKDGVTMMRGMFVDCTLAVKEGTTPLYVSFFYFSSDEKIPYRNVLVFSNTGTQKKSPEKDFILSTRQRIQFLKKINNKVSLIEKKKYFFERAYAGGGGSTSSGGSSSDTGTSDTGTTPTPPSDPVSSLVSYISQTFGTPSAQAMNAINAGGNGFSLTGTSGDAAGMTSIGYNQYCCTTQGYAISVVSGSGTSGGSSGSGTGGSSFVTTPPGLLFSSDPSSVTWNTPTTLTWSSAAADSCTASGAWSGSVPLSGPQTSSPLTSPSTFNLYCSNAIGNSPTVSTSVNVCSEGTPTWDGTTCQTPTGTITSNSCAISLGSSDCAMNVVWTTQYPSGVPEVRRPYAGDSVLASGVSGNGSYVFPYQAAPYTLDLYDRTVKLSSANFVAHCVVGGFDTLTSLCVNPTVGQVTVTGQYYSTPGHVSFSCNNSDSYQVLKNGILFTSGAYTGPKTIAVTDSANYSVLCLSGNYPSTPTVKYYNSPPPPDPIISIVASPRTIAKNTETILTWSVQFPIPSCKLTAKVVCPNDACGPEQIAEEAALKVKLVGEKTDMSDPNGSRSITSAVKTMIPSHIDTDWKALGKKTLTLSHSADFTITCGAQKGTVRVRVAQSGEQ
jgi:hypothetical protein